MSLWFQVVLGLRAKWLNLAALISPLQQPHGELSEPGKSKHLSVQFADESVEYAIKGRSTQYELLERAIKDKSMQYGLKVAANQSNQAKVCISYFVT